MGGALQSLRCGSFGHPPDDVMWEKSSELGYLDWLQRAMQTHLHIHLIMACCVQAPVRSLMQMAAFVEPHVEAFADLPLNSSDLQQEQVGLCDKTSRPLSLSSWHRSHMQLHDLPSCRQPDMH